jgi:hypothetical protein
MTDGVVTVQSRIKNSSREIVYKRCWVDHFTQNSLPGFVQDTRVQVSGSQFQLCFVSEKKLLIHECEHFMKVHGMHA